MQRQPVSSSGLRDVGYEEDSRTLEIGFQNGRVYQYQDVPPIVHDELLTAASLGSYFQSRIRNQYRHRRIS